MVMVARAMKGSRIIELQIIVITLSKTDQIAISGLKSVFCSAVCHSDKWFLHKFNDMLVYVCSICVKLHEHTTPVG